MKKMIIVFLLMAAIKPSLTIFDFEKESNLVNWYTVEDVVMGGRSDGGFQLNEAGHGVFSGEVSLENNGGFSSLRHRFNPLNVKGYKKAVVRLKGDGKRYQFRVKSSINQRHAYIYYFTTTSEWQTVEIPLGEMYPTFRGRKLDMANYPAEVMGEIAFLIANKKNERFRLEIDKIELL